MNSKKGDIDDDPNHSNVDPYNFDLVLNLENEAYDEGHKEGYQNGILQGQKEGKEVGIVKGFEYGVEIAYYISICKLIRSQLLMETDSSSSKDKPTEEESKFVEESGILDTPVVQSPDKDPSLGLCSSTNMEGDFSRSLKFTIDSNQNQKALKSITTIIEIGNSFQLKDSDGNENDITGIITRIRTRFRALCINLKLTGLEFRVPKRNKTNDSIPSSVKSENSSTLDSLTISIEETRPVVSKKESLEY